MHKLVYFLGPIAVIAGAVYLVFAGALFFLQDHLVYHPDRRIVATPRDAGLPYQEVQFRTADNLLLSGWFIPAPPSKTVLLFCHGNAGNISHRLESISLFHELGLNVFIFDYRGFGASEGRPNEEGTYRDGEAAWHYLIKERAADAAQMIVFGRSLGAAVAVWVARHHPPQALILESAFTSVPDLGAAMYPFLPVRRITRYQYNNLEQIRHITCPVLIIHSRDDRTIPFTHGRRLFEAAREPKEFLEIRGSHNDGFMVSGDLYKSGWQAFLKNHAAGRR